MKLSIFSLYSGSSGNSFLLMDENTRILIDAGKNLRALTKALAECGTAPEELDAVFVTHTHSDHISALQKLCAACPIPVHLTEEGLPKIENAPEIAAVTRIHPRVYTETVGAWRITSFPTPHDEPGSVGYRIETPAGTVGYATDIGYISEDVRKGLSGCRAVILESNHDPEMLQSGPYPDFLKKRIASRKGHLSNGECAEFAAGLYGNGTERIMLAHLSATNNTPELAYESTFGAIADGAVFLTVAAPDRVTGMFLED